MGSIVVLDIEGVANLPGRQAVLSSLGERPYIFWTSLPNRKIAQKRLDDVGIHVHPEKIMSRTEAEKLQAALIRARNEPYDKNILREELRSITGIGYGDDAMQRAVGSLPDWLSLQGKTSSWKYPPALGFQRSILVESDNGYRMGTSRRWSGTTGARRMVDATRELPPESTFSLLMVPEDPLYPQSVTRAIMNGLSEWRNGTNFVRHLKPSYHLDSAEGKPKHRRYL